MLKLPRALLQTLYIRAETAAPRECVGLLFGFGESVTRSVPLENIAETPNTRFVAGPLDVLQALKGADERGDSLLGVYHSHPSGPAQLSEHDLAYAQPGTVQLLLTPPTVQAFRVVDGVAAVVRLELV